MKIIYCFQHYFLPEQEIYFNKETVPRDSYDPCGNICFLCRVKESKPWDQRQRIDQRITYGPFSHATMWIPTNHNQKRLLTSHFSVLTVHIHLSIISIRSIHLKYNCYNYVWVLKAYVGILWKLYMWMVSPITKAKNKHHKLEKIFLNMCMIKDILKS